MTHSDIEGKDVYVGLLTHALYTILMETKERNHEQQPSALIHLHLKNQTSL